MSEIEHWTREGFAGDGAHVRRPDFGPQFLRAEGSHVPRRLNVANVAVAPDGAGAAAVELAKATSGARLSLVSRRSSTPYVERNVDCDEVYFVQHGEARVRTSFGTLTAGAGEFVCIPRGVTYQIGVPADPLLAVLIESPKALRLSTKRPDLLDPERDVRRPVFAASPAGNDEVLLLLKGGNATTRFLLPHDPLAASEFLGGVQPVWKVHLSQVRPATDSSPVQFLETDGNDVLLYTLSARPGRRRPPVHINADYDEIIYYFCGPGAWGAVDEPGTLTCVPRGVAHQGPSEDVPAGYLAWLLETRETLQWSPAALAVAELMETDMYGRHTSAAATR